MSKKELHVGVVGVGARGFGLVRDAMCGREGNLRIATESLGYCLSLFAIWRFCT